MAGSGMCPVYGRAKDLNAASFSDLCFGIKSFAAFRHGQFLACPHLLQHEWFLNNRVFCLFAYLSVEDCVGLIWELDIFYGEVLSDGNPFSTNKLYDGQSVKHFG